MRSHIKDIGTLKGNKSYLPVTIHSAPVNHTLVHNPPNLRTPQRYFNSRNISPQGPQPADCSQFMIQQLTHPKQHASSYKQLGHFLKSFAMSTSWISFKGSYNWLKSFPLFFQMYFSAASLLLAVVTLQTNHQFSCLSHHSMLRSFPSLH